MHDVRPSTFAAYSVRAPSRSDPKKIERDMAPVRRAYALEARISTHRARTPAY